MQFWILDFRQIINLKSKILCMGMKGEKTPYIPLSTIARISLTKSAGV